MGSKFKIDLEDHFDAILEQVFNSGSKDTPSWLVDLIMNAVDDEFDYGETDINLVVDDAVDFSIIVTYSWDSNWGEIQYYAGVGNTLTHDYYSNFGYPYDLLEYALSDTDMLFQCFNQSFQMPE